MKTLVKIFLNILFVLAIVLFSISLTLKFQILNPNFWKKTFTENETYQALSDVIKNNLNSQVTVGGGSKNDASLLTNLITPGNVKDVVENNVDNLLYFINGGKSDIFVYLPVGSIPVEFLPVTHNKISSETKLQDLLTEFNVEGISASQIEQIKVIGTITNIVLILSALVAIGILLILHFSALTIFLGSIAVGISMIVIAFSRNFIVNGFFVSQNMIVLILKIVGPPVLQEIIKLWIYESLFMILTGVIVIYVKTRSLRVRKK